MSQSALHGVTVVELPGNSAVAFCGRLFASFGATVTKVTESPSPAKELSALDSATQLYLDHGKAIVSHRIDTSAGLDKVIETCRGADAVLSAGMPEWWPPSTADRSGEALGNGQAPLLGILSDFGHDGPYREFRGTALLGAAAGGYLYTNGDEDREPLKGVPFQPYAQTGLSGFTGLMAALIERMRTGRTQVVSTSLFQTLATLHDDAAIRYSHGGIIPRRLGNRYAVEYPVGLFPTLDGNVAITLVDKRRSDFLLTSAGHPEAADDPRFADGVSRSIHADVYRDLFEPWFRRTASRDLLATLDTVRLASAAVVSVPDVLADPHLAERDFWESLPSSPTATVLAPGVPVHVLAESQGQAPNRDGDPARTGITQGGPLSGVRVIDVTAGWSGPLATRLLGDLGADVIRVEAPWARGTAPPDERYVQESGYFLSDPAERFWMKNGAYNTWAFNKRALAIRLERPEGREIFGRLVASADMLIDNLSTQAWEHLGMTPEEILHLNPGIVAVTMPGYGRWGPDRYKVSYGNQIEAAIGVVDAMGYEGQGPHMSSVAWPDPCGSMYAAATALVGWWEGQRTATGRVLELSQMEAALTFIGPEVVHYGLTGTAFERRGSRDTRYEPQGVYGCAGDDRWVALSVTSEPEWHALCEVLGRRDLRHLTMTERQGQRADVDAAVSEWAARRSSKDAMWQLQAAGVPAFAVNDMRDVVDDPYLRFRSAYIHVDGELLCAFPVGLSNTPAKVYRGVADIGEHNEEILAELGYSPVEIRAFKDAGHIANRPTAPD